MADTSTIKDRNSLTTDDFTASAEPFRLFSEWFNDAVKAEPNDPTAMTLATVDASGMPDARMVLMKGFDESGFVFYSHIDSAKGRELAANPKAALVFHWKSLQAAGPHPRRRHHGDAGRGRRLFRDAAEAGADRRVGQQAEPATGEPLRLRAGDR